MQFHSNQRTFICGKTDSGKTYFAIKSFFLKLNRVILYDIKHELNGFKATYCHKPEDIVWCWQHNRHKIVYQPPPGIDLEEDFDALCYIIFHHANCVLIVDEVASVTAASRIPKWFSECLRLGRGRNIGVISLSQRPKEIFNTIISEADYIVGFLLQIKDDRKKVAGVVGPDAMKLNIIPKHHYLLYSAYEGVSFHKPIR